MIRTSCGACGGGDLEVILDLGSSPVADAYQDEPGPVDRYSLEVAVCRTCRLVQLLEVLPRDRLFGTGYSFYSSASRPLSAYHERYARDLTDAFGPRFAVEVGCNDGDFLRHLAAAGWPTLGVDPAGGPVKVARERGLDVVNEPFGLEVAHRIRDGNGRASVIVANHVLAHVESVSDVLAGVRELLSDDGIAYVEVQYLPDLLLNNAFDLVYHEHRNFFSLTSLSDAARRHGLLVTGAWLTDRQGGSLRVTLRHRADHVVVSPVVWQLLGSEEWLREDATYAGLQGRAERLRARLRDLLTREVDAGRRLIGYGASAKATTLLSFCDLGDALELVIDTTPAKQGRYVPGTTARIVPPEDVLLNWQTTVLLTAWNYLGTIIRNNELHCRWIVPVPAPVVL